MASWLLWLRVATDGVACLEALRDAIVACWEQNKPNGMASELGLHHRRSVRLRGHDYAAPATYLVTVCTHERSPLFGTHVNGRVRLTDAGAVVCRCWQTIPDHFPGVSLDVWIVMPDHVHGIVRVGRRGDACVAPTAIPTLTGVPRGPRPQSLAAIVGSFKSAVTRCLHQSGATAGGPVWQRGYYEQIIRDVDGLDRARDYIRSQG